MDIKTLASLQILPHVIFVESQIMQPSHASIGNQSTVMDADSLVTKPNYVILRDSAKKRMPLKTFPYHWINSPPETAVTAIAPPPLGGELKTENIYLNSI